MNETILQKVLKFVRQNLVTVALVAVGGVLLLTGHVGIAIAAAGAGAGLYFWRRYQANL